MNFGDALKSELESVQGLKVFPIIANKDSKGPFAVYRRTRLKPRKTLSGMSPKVEASYSIVVIAESYSQLQQISDDVFSKLISFHGRAIGIDGPVVENITVEMGGDEFDPDIEKFRANITLDINY